MKFDLNYIRKYMNKLDDVTGFNSKDIELFISKRMIKTYAYNQMKWGDCEKLVNWKQVYSEALLNCGVSEEELQEIIKHEYCHAWADFGSKRGYKHNDKEYIAKCNFLGCDYACRNKNEELFNKYNKYINNINKKKQNKVINYRKDYFDKMVERYKCKYVSEIGKRLNILQGKKLFSINLTLYNRFTESSELEYMFKNGCNEIISCLKNTKGINIINQIQNSRTGDIHISYTHEI